MNSNNWTTIAYTLLRVVAGFLFLQHGGQKLLGWFGGVGGGGGGSLPPLILVAGVLELVGGTLVLLGLLTRPVAFLLSGEMAVAYFQFHFKPEAPWPAQNQGLAAALLAFTFLFMCAYGSGPWSLDALFWGKRRAASGSAQAGSEG